LIISAVHDLWEDALGKFLSVVRRSQGLTALAEKMEQSTVRPANASSYGVRSTGFQS
jgi:hypothetical protein